MDLAVIIRGLSESCVEILQTLSLLSPGLPQLLLATQIWPRRSPAVWIQPRFQLMKIRPGWTGEAETGQELIVKDWEESTEAVGNGQINLNAHLEM